MEKILLDVHAHLIPAAEAGLADFEGVVWDKPLGKFSVDGHPVGIRSLFKPLDLLEWMDKNRVENAWISVPPPVYRPQLDRSSAARWVAALNEGLSVIAAAHPLRLAPLFHLPVEHPELAAHIAAEKIAKGHTRFSMAAGGTEHVLSAAELMPLWQSLHDASGFLFLHPGEGCDPRLDPFYLHNLLGNPTETAIGASHLIFAGILERYAQMTICLAHAGGTTASLAGRSAARQRRVPDWILCWRRPNARSAASASIASRMTMSPCILLPGLSVTTGSCSGRTGLFRWVCCSRTRNWRRPARAPDKRSSATIPPVCSAKNDGASAEVDVRSSGKVPCSQDVPEFAEAFAPNDDLVALLQKQLRLAGIADAAGRSGQNDVAWMERHAE